jgi:serine/threonine-protein kinase
MDDVEALIASGRHAEAARELRRRGELERAQALYEKLWDFRSAAEVARERGDRPSLLRLLLDARDFGEATRVGQALLGAAPGEQVRAAEVYERRRMWAEAATLREALGELTVAHLHYRAAQLPLEAARLDEVMGRLREAGMEYERFLAAEPGSPDAPRAHLALGRLLAGFGRHEEAARHLQKAVGDAQLAERARRALVVALVELGYREGAASVLDALRAVDPRVPALDAFLAAERQRAAADSDGGARLAGRYRVRRLLGSGGMGRVYLADDALTGREVAVKVVAPPVDARLREGYHRFVREARVVSSLRHPNIVAVVDFHESLGLLAMEYMAGGTLADRLPGPLGLGAVRALALELVAALEAAHAHGVIHRDLKPANVFFTASGTAKLGDFGVAHLQDLGATQTAGFIGTLAYMSPEQISGAPLHFASDVYALGVTLFQALTGRLPFSGPDFVGQHLGDAPPLPSSLRPGLPPAWDRLVLRALEKEPGARFASLEELRHAAQALPVDVAASADLTEPEPAREPEPGPRYAVDARLPSPAWSQLERATDTRLGRQVIRERFDAAYLAGSDGLAHLAWLRAMARAGGPHLQRVLRIERLADGGGCVVYEAVAGPPPAELDATQRRAVELALEPVHAAGRAHGHLATSLVMEEHGPTVLVAGRRDVGAAPDDDRAALARLSATAAR